MIIEITEDDAREYVGMLDNLLYFDTMPTEYFVLLDKLIGELEFGLGEEK